MRFFEIKIDYFQKIVVGLFGVFEVEVEVIFWLRPIFLSIVSNFVKTKVTLFNYEDQDFLSISFHFHQDQHQPPFSSQDRGRPF